jgi:hypothetical protein
MRYRYVCSWVWKFGSSCRMMMARALPNVIKTCPRDGGGGGIPLCITPDVSCLLCSGTTADCGVQRSIGREQCSSRWVKDCVAFWM